MINYSEITCETKINAFLIYLTKCYVRNVAPLAAKRTVN